MGLYTCMQLVDGVVENVMSRTGRGWRNSARLGEENEWAEFGWCGRRVVVSPFGIRRGAQRPGAFEGYNKHHRSCISCKSISLHMVIL